MDSYMDQYRPVERHAYYRRRRGGKYQARHEARNGVQVNMRDVPAD
jgi:hypothetical protein